MDQPYPNSPSKFYNGQPSQGLLQFFLFEGHNHLQFWNEVFRLPTALPQGQLAEVPLYFEIFTIKVDG